MEIAARERLDSQREGPNLCFYWQAWYETEISHFAKKPKTDDNRRKIVPTGLREPAVRKKLDFFAPGGESALILIASVRSRAPRGHPKVSFVFTGTFLGTLPALPGPPVTLPRHPRVAPVMLLGATGRPERVPGSILIDFGCPKGSPGIDFGSTFAPSLLGKLLENTPRMPRNIP